MPSRARVGRGPGGDAFMRRPSMDLWFSVVMLTAHRLEEVEVAAEVSLLHVLGVEQAESPLEPGRGGHPCGAARGELLIAHEQLDPACGHVEPDAIPAAHEREGSADVRLRRHVEHARTVARAAHA